MRGFAKILEDGICVEDNSVIEEHALLSHGFVFVTGDSIVGGNVCLKGEDFYAGTTVKDYCIKEDNCVITDGYVSPEHPFVYVSFEPDLKKVAFYLKMWKCKDVGLCSPHIAVPDELWAEARRRLVKS